METKCPVLRLATDSAPPAASPAETQFRAQAHPRHLCPQGHWKPNIRAHNSGTAQTATPSSKRRRGRGVKWQLLRLEPASAQLRGGPDPPLPHPGALASSQVWGGLSVPCCLRLEGPDQFSPVKPPAELPTTAIPIATQEGSLSG